MSTLWERNKAAIEEYGTVFLIVGFAIFAIEMVTLTALISWGVDVAPLLAWVQATFGFDVSGVADSAGALFVAYAISRLLKPVHILVTLALTPIVARWVPDAWFKDEKQAPPAP